MTGHFTQYYFTQGVVADAAYSVSAIVALYPGAYLLGSFGGDLFAERVYKDRLKDADPAQLFGITAHHIYTTGSKCKLSYMLGFTARYALEMAASPYISFFEKNGVAGYFGGKKEKISAEDIAIGIDRHIIRDYLGNEKAMALEHKLKIDKGVMEEIADLYYEVINDVADLCFTRRKTLSVLEDVKFDMPLAEGMGRIDYMNREHREWIDSSGAAANLSFDELLSSGLPVAYELITEYMNVARNNKELNYSLFGIPKP